MEYNDIYDHNRRRTGRLHLRGTRWHRGEYGLMVCVWVYDGKGHLLMTRRATEKTFPGTWENSGGAAKVGESSRRAIVRELFEETGIRAKEEDFELIDSRRDKDAFFDFYCLKNATPIEDIVLLPGETTDAKWVTFDEVHRMIRKKEICHPIARQFLRQEKMLLERQDEEN